MRNDRKKIGDAGEDAAAYYLTQRGYSVIGRNFRTVGGEIDIIAAAGSTIVFVEVKTLPNGSPELFSAVLNAGKQRRIIETAKCFLQNHREYSNYYIRFDVIAINMPGFPSVYHIENAFTELL